MYWCVLVLCVCVLASMRVVSNLFPVLGAQMIPQQSCLADDSCSAGSGHSVFTGSTSKYDFMVGTGGDVVSLHSEYGLGHKAM